jgi:hypothetical protein
LITWLLVKFTHLGVPALVELVVVAGLVVLVVLAAGFVYYKLTTFVPL